MAWHGSSQCEGELAVAERLAVLAPELSLARGRAPAAIDVQVTVERGPGSQWSVSLELDGPHGHEQRGFVAESCAVAIEATALVLAVAIDPVGVATRIELEPPSPEPAAPLPERSSEPEAREPHGDASNDSDGSDDRSEIEPSLNLTLDAPTPAEPAAAERPRLGLALVGGGGYGPLRSGSAMLAGRLAAIGPRWRAQLRAGWLPPIRSTLADRGRARVDGFLIAASGCGVLAAGPVEFPLCAGLEAGAVRARALAPIENPEAASQPYLGVTLGPGLSWAPIDRLALGVEVEAVIPLVFGGFALDGQPALDNLPAGVRALAGVELRLP